MSRIEELPDDYDENADVAPSKPEEAPSALGPAPPPKPEKQSIDDLVKDLKKSPFFMTSLDDAGDEENIELEAIRALIYEGTRAEIASNFKEQGNEEARLKHWKEARELYSKGLAALKAERKEEDPVGEEEDRKERRVKEVLHVNKALCELERENYRSCTLDCMAALEINTGNVKAHFRLASALFKLDKLAEAASACSAGLSVDPANPSLINLSGQIKTRQTVKEVKERKRREEAERVKKEVAMVAIALKARQIRTRNTGKPPEMQDAVVKLTPDPLSPTSTLIFPVLVLYPLHLQSDIIKAFGEEETLQGHLEYLLPLPWDRLGEYTVKGVEAYVDTAEGGMIKWGKKVELLKVLSGGKVDVVDGLIKVNLVPKSRAPEWIETVKRNSK